MKVTPLADDVDEGRHLQIDEKKAPFVKEIFQRFADGEAIKTIIADMNARGVGITVRMKKKAGRKAYEQFEKVQKRMAANTRAPAVHKAEVDL